MELLKASNISNVSAMSTERGVPDDPPELWVSLQRINPSSCWQLRRFWTVVGPLISRARVR